MTMNCVRDRCRCCFSAEALETLQPTLIDILKLIRNPQDVKIDDYPTEACFKCHNLLKEVHRFKRKCQAVDEIFRNNLQNVEHEVDLILKNANDDDIGDIHVKKELVIEYDGNEQIDIEINKIEMDSESDDSQDGFETYPEDPLVLIDEINRPTKDLPSELNEEKEINKKTERKTKGKSKIHKKERCSGVVKRRRKYLTDKPFECDECSYKCSKPSDLTLHKRKHTGERPYACELCSYTCAVRQTLSKHMRNKHSDLRPYACDECDYRSKTKSTLLMHKKQHSGLRDFACELCSYKCIQLEKLKNHMMSTHTGEKPFFCDRCPYRTVSAGNLRTHLKFSHEDHKKFKCTECTFASSKLSNLQAHLTMHTGEKPFQCDLCDTKFTVASSFKRHLKKKHGKPTIK